MTQEEKAKAYDEAIKRARKWYDANTNEGYRGIFEEIFPELKESEDERIRETLIKFFSQGVEYDSSTNGIYDKDIVAWLEKQGEQKKSYDTCDSSMMDNKKSPYSEKRDFGYFEEKPADKVEPKFKIGDWIINESHDICLITEIDLENNYYICESNRFGNTDGDIDLTDKAFHLWTIQDAKDGDVLVDVYENIGIYQQHDDFDWTSYCSLGFHGGFQNFKVEHENDKTHPATKEQSDQLEKAMKEEGYEWNAYKKELKKIPNASEECEIEHIEHGKYYYCIKDYYSGGCKRASKGEVVQALRGMSMMALGAKANKYFIPVKCIVDIKPAWSEEDAEMFEQIEESLDYYRTIVMCDKDYALADIVSKEITWFKSLKDRIGG